MRCEICNRSMTETYLDGEGDEHFYCIHCADEIRDTLESYDEEDEEWYWVGWDEYEDDPDEEDGADDEP